MKALPFALSTLSLALAACVTAPAETTPTVQAVDGIQLGLGTQAAPAADGAWWQVYGDPQLDQLMQGIESDGLRRITGEAADSRFDGLC